MNQITDLLNRIKATIAENNLGLADNRLTDLNNRCQNISDSLTSISQTLEQIQAGEVAPEDYILQELNLPEFTSESLMVKLEEILELATNNKQENQELVAKVRETEEELRGILNALQTQQRTITNYQDQITTLETKIKANENQAKDLQIRAGVIAASMVFSLEAIAIILAKWIRRV